MSLLKSKAFHPVTVEYNTWKGQVYGVPFLEGSKPALFYNTKMFKEAGLDPNKPPATFDELMTYAQKLTKRDAAGNPTRAGITLRLVGPGLGRRREVLVRALRHGRRSARPDQVGQVAQQLRQRRRARGA